MDGDIDGANQSFSVASPSVTTETSKTTETGGSVALAPAASQTEPGTETAAAAALPQQAEGAQDGSQTQTPPAKPGESPAASAEPVAANAGDAKFAPGAAPETQPAPAQAEAAAATATPKPKQSGFLASFFNSGKATEPAPTQVALATVDAGADTAEEAPPVPASKPSQAPSTKKASESAKPQLSLENVAPLGEKTSRVAARRNEAPEITSARASAFLDDGEGTGLPGVRQSALFEIKRKSGIDDDSDVDIHEDVDGGMQVATAGGLARLAPNGLLKQRENVDVACLKPSLVRVLKTIERRFGKRVVITSGYRSPSHNRRVRGAKRSQHMYCAAADIQVPGVSKWELASYARSLSGRGGVGTYCHTTSVHVDVGPERDWNWRCRGRRI